MNQAQEQIKRLTESFPCLRSKFHNYNFGDFDPDALWKASGVWSKGERLCLAFVLNVWTGNRPRQEWFPFDLLEFIATADSGNKAAVINWIVKPYWP
jgi:hypothetical protein